MTQIITATPIDYPESDGKPMSDNTRQFRWIQTLAANLAALFRDRADVFVCGNQNWYPVEGHKEIVAAPDVYAVFGRPKGERGSYKQWEEGGVPMTVVFEVLSPSNSPEEMADKLLFYDDHGVEEYYVFDPDRNTLEGYVRGQATLRRMRPAHGFVSPRLGIRFDLSGPELVVYRPDGRPFLTFEELEIEREQERRRADEAHARANEERRRVEQERQRADEERQRADEERQRADEERQRADEERARAERERQRAEQAEAELVRLRRLLDERA